MADADELKQWADKFEEAADQWKEFVANKVDELNELAAGELGDDELKQWAADFQKAVLQRKKFVADYWEEGLNRAVALGDDELKQWVAELDEHQAAKSSAITRLLELAGAPDNQVARDALDRALWTASSQVRFEKGGVHRLPPARLRALAC